jgi:hypothetical protein
MTLDQGLKQSIFTRATVDIFWSFSPKSFSQKK